MEYLWSIEIIFLTSKELKLRRPPLFSTLNFAFGLLRPCRRYMCCAMAQLLPEGKKVFLKQLLCFSLLRVYSLSCLLSKISFSKLARVKQFTTRRHTTRFVQICHVIITLHELCSSLRQSSLAERTGDDLTAKSYPLANNYIHGHRLEIVSQCLPSK